MSFTVLARDPASAARRGRLQTLHGAIETPVFMPVGTQGTVKAVLPGQVRDLGAQILLGNTYHLHLRPGDDLIAELGGLHRFMGWEGAILTDSGGFQAFSLAKLTRVREDGIEFRSHLDGRPVFFGPRETVAIQTRLGSDIAMVIDECPPAGAPHADCARAVERSARWARACLAYANETGWLAAGHHLFAIAQGGVHEDLRVAAARDLASEPFPGFAIGGVSVGESEEDMLRQVGWAAPHLPADRPRYVMGVGQPHQILAMVALGVDLFDCVLPTRVARNGAAYTPDGLVHLRNERFRRDPRPLVEGLDNAAAAFSRAYLRHLVAAEEILGATLLTIHNVHFYVDLLRQARAHLEAGDFLPWSRAWIERYQAGTAAARN